MKSFEEIHAEYKEVIERLRRNIPLHMNPYNLGDEGETTKLIYKLITLFESIPSPNTPSEPSTIPVVDYEKEAEKLYPYPEMCIDNEGEVARRIRNTIDKERSAHIRARLMSFPSNTNSKVKELVEWINQNYPLSIFKPIKEKANSLIQQ